MNRKEEKLLFECLAVLLGQNSMTINPQYQEELVKQCEKTAEVEFEYED